MKSAIKKNKRSSINNKRAYNLRLVWVIISTTPVLLNILSAFTLFFLVLDEFYLKR